MTRLSRWDITYRPGGWARAKATEEDTAVYLHLRPSGEGSSVRFNVHMAAMRSSMPVSSNVWRSVPIEIIERSANEDDEVRACITLDTDGGAPDLDALDHYFEGRGPSTVRHHRSGAATITADSAVSVGTGREHYAYASGSAKASGSISRDGVITTRQHAPGELPKLANPQGRITPEFLEELANVYRWLVANGWTAPAPAIAEQTGAPLGTVRRWIGDARKRGFLPPGRPGRAG